MKKTIDRSLKILYVVIVANLLVEFAIEKNIENMLNLKFVIIAIIVSLSAAIFLQYKDYKKSSK